jgi:hypothetical protein
MSLTRKFMPPSTLVLPRQIDHKQVTRVGELRLPAGVPANRSAMSGGNVELVFVGTFVITTTSAGIGRVRECRTAEATRGNVESGWKVDLHVYLSIQIKSDDRRPSPPKQPDQRMRQGSSHETCRALHMHPSRSMHNPSQNESRGRLWAIASMNTRRLDTLPSS